MVDIVHRLLEPKFADGVRREAAAEIQKLRLMLVKQIEQQAYPCSPHCAGYIREQGLQFEIDRLRKLIPNDDPQ